MMRTLLCTLALAAFAATTHAVTTNWTNSGNITSTQKATLSPNFFGGSVFAVTASFTASSVSNGTNLFKVGRADEGSNSYETANYAGVRITQGEDNQSVLSIFAKGGGGSEETASSSFVVKSNERITVSLIVNRATPNTLSLFVNGKDTGTTLTLSTAMNTPNKTLWAYGSSSLTLDYLSVYGKDAEESLEAFTETAQKASTLPEPTALALLALGVAGLALRRKVA